MSIALQVQEGAPNLFVVGGPAKDGGPAPAMAAGTSEGLGQGWWAQLPEMSQGLGSGAHGSMLSMGFTNGALTPLCLAPHSADGGCTSPRFTAQPGPAWGMNGPKESVLDT